MNTWMIPLLNISYGIKEFSFNYEGHAKISITGVLRDTWVISMKVDALPLFIHGCNNLVTDFKDKNAMINYQLMQVFNQLSQYGITDKNLIEAIKSNKDYAV